MSAPTPARPPAAPWLRRLAPALAVAAALAGPPAAAQEPAAAPPAEESAAEPEASWVHADPLERDTPRGSLRGFLRAARRGDWDTAARHLDLSAVPAADRAVRGPLLARHLKRVLDQSLWIDLGGLSDRPEGDLGEEGLGPGRERVGVIALPAGGRVEVLLERVPEDGARVWKVAAPTVARVPELYAVLGYGPLDRWLPAPFFDWGLFGIQLWQWIGLALVVAGAWAVSWLLARLALRLVRPLARRSLSTLDDDLLEHGRSPLRLLLALGLALVGVMALRLAVPVEAFLVRLVQVLVVVAVIHLAFRLVDIFSRWSQGRLLEGGQVAAIGLLPLARKVAKVFLAALGLLAVLQNVGVNVTALITGLGVGGLAIALAAQKSIENLFGGMTLVVDQPVRVGDVCRFGTQLGTVEAVGLRSTRIRTPDRTLITVPNAQFSELELETFAARDRIRLLLTVGLRYETTPDQMRFLLVELRKLLYAHPRVLEDPARVRFVGLGAHSLDIEVFAYVDTADFHEFLAVQEDVLLRILELVAASGTDFAFPSQTLYMERGAGVDPEKTREAETRVAEWRRRHELQLPHFTREAIDGLEGTLEYPPSGSALAAVEGEG